MRDKIVAYVGSTAIFIFITASIGLVGFVPEVATHPTNHTVRLGIVVLAGIIGVALGVAVCCAFLTDEDDDGHTDI